MQYILFFTLSFASSLALAEPLEEILCSEVGPAEYKTLSVNAVNYFYDEIATRKGAVVTLSSLKFSEVDCHDYDTGLSNMEFELKWDQQSIIEGVEVKQACTETIAVNYDGVEFIAQDETCENYE